MSKIKTMLPEDYSIDSRGDEMSMIAQERYELEQANRLWELSKYSDRELHDELARRLLKPLTDATNKLKDTLDKLDNSSVPF